ncbi:Pet127-domain-containing protein [Aspergillus crustosus]
MFRSSLRSAPKGLREHVCLSCLARNSERRVQLRPFYSTPLSRAASSTQVLDNSSNQETNGAIDSLKTSKTLESEPHKPSAANATNAKPPKHLRKHRVSSGDGVKHKLRGRLRPQKHEFQALKVKTEPVPRLSYGLDRVLFNPGVYHLRDRRTRVYNFDPYLGSIMPVSQFDFAALKDYITSSKDGTLRKYAIKNKKKYIGSSSSMTGTLTHFHLLLSAFRPLSLNMLSRAFSENLDTFTRLSRAPAAMFLRYQNGVYAIDADKEFDSANILMNLGKSMEKLLTLPKEEFERYRITHKNKITPEEEALTPEAFHYSTYGDFLMRSQLDAYDPRMPGTGMFDLKTRAVVSIRMDVRNFEKGLGYQIKQPLGKYESFEREYYDMIRSAFLKYSLQVRVGRMDGIFVAFHNIEKIFGFQYVSLGEMDYALHGQNDRSLGDTEFQLSLQLWNRILNMATTKYPKQNLRFHFEAREGTPHYMNVFYEPVTDEQIIAIQTKNQAEIDAFQKRILNLKPKTNNQGTPPSSFTPASSTQPTPSNQDLQVESSKTASSAPDKNPDHKISGMVIRITNRQNGTIVTRPEKFKKDHAWSVEFDIEELACSQAQKQYASCAARRKKILADGREDIPEEKLSSYIRILRELSKKGRQLAKRDQALDKKNGVIVCDDETKS